MSCIAHQIARLLIDAELRRSAEELHNSSASEEQRLREVATTPIEPDDESEECEDHSDSRGK